MARRTVLVSRLLLLVAVVFGTAGARANCAPQCVTTASVTTMAGMGNKLMPAADGIIFAGNKLAPAGAAAVKQLAQDTLQFTAGMKRERWRLNLQVRADPGLPGPRAKAQVKARQQTLAQALAAAGIAKCHVNGYCAVAPARR